MKFIISSYRVFKKSKFQASTISNQPAISAIFACTFNHNELLLVNFDKKVFVCM
jgi:hypothetical protein